MEQHHRHNRLEVVSSSLPLSPGDLLNINHLVQTSSSSLHALLVLLYVTGNLEGREVAIETKSTLLSRGIVTIAAIHAAAGAAPL
jgi:hypothetical protein